MGYKEIFKKAEEDVLPLLRSITKEPKFIDECEEALSGKGIPFDLIKNNVESLLKKVEKKEKDENGSGIYIFWANFSNWHRAENSKLKERLNDFSKIWDEPQKENIKYSPRSNKGNIEYWVKKNHSLGKKLPFYVGKSEKLWSRVAQHIKLEGEKSTYALKLKARKNMLSGIKFNVVLLPLHTEKEGYFLVGLVEKMIRKKLRPIIGKI